MKKSDAPKYLNLSIGAPARLAELRTAFAQHETRYPNCPEAYKSKNWRNVRTSNFRNWQDNFAALSQGFTTRCGREIPVWYCHTGEQFRKECYADEVENSPIDHAGWFSDEECNEKVRGIVARLPHGRFISGYEWSSNGERVYFAEVFDDIREAARNADEEARIFAELCRDDDAKFREAQRLEDENETAL